MKNDLLPLAFYTLSSLMIIATAVFVFLQRRQGRVNLLAPANFVMLSFAVQYGILNREPILWGIKLHPFLLGGEWMMIRAMQVALASMVAFGASYFLSARAMRRRWGGGPPQRREFHVDLRLPAVLVLYGAGLAVRLVMIRMGVYGYMGDLSRSDLGVTMILARVERFCSFSLIAVVIAWCLFPKKNILRLSLAALFLSELFFNFLGGTKGLTLINFFYVGLVYWYIRRRIPSLKWALTAVAVWALITPWNLAYREFLEEAPALSTGLSGDTELMQDSFRHVYASSKGAAAGAIEVSLEHVKARLRLLQEATLVMEYADQYGFTYGKKYWLFLPSALIPRVLWPDKPQYEIGQWVTRQIFSEEITEGRTSTAISGIGDLYMDFGTAGPVLGFALWGLFFGWFETRYERSARGVLLIAGLYINLINIGGNETFGIMAGIIKDLVVLALFAWMTGFGWIFHSAVPGQGSAPSWKPAPEPAR